MLMMTIKNRLEVLFFFAVEEEFQNKYRVDVIDSTTLRLTIMNVEIGDTGKYGFFEGHTSIIYSLIFHGKSKIFYGKFAACSCDAAWRDAHLGDRMCSSVAVAGVSRICGYQCVTRLCTQNKHKN